MPSFGIKSQRSRSLIAQNSNRITVSTQVINEICANLIKREGFSASQTRDVIIDFYAVYDVIEVERNILLTATILREQFTLSYWDSLIVSSALSSSASILYSEDMHDGLIIDQKLVIINPFK